MNYLMPLGGLARWYQVYFAVTYKVGAAHFFEGLAQCRPVLGIVVAQKGFV